MAGNDSADLHGSTGVAAPSLGSPGIIECVVDGYLVPVDPMNDLRCESCE